MGVKLSQREEQHALFTTPLRLCADFNKLQRLALKYFHLFCITD